MQRASFLAAAVAACAAIAAPAGAGVISANAVVTAAADGPDFDYTITLTNTSGAGNDSIGTFWFSWVPGEDFMHTSPLSVINPSGWKDTITNGGATDGFAIQWKEITPGTADITPGNSLTFKFTSADSPAQLMGNSVFHSSSPVLTSFVYQGAPFSGDSQQFTAAFASTAVPEPSSLSLGLVAIAGSLAWRRLRRRANG